MAGNHRGINLPLVIASVAKQSVGLMKKSLKTRGIEKSVFAVIARYEVIFWIDAEDFENQKTKILS
jgi:hypothetical protein